MTGAPQLLAASQKMSVALSAQQTVRQQMEGLAQNLRALPAVTDSQIPDLAEHIRQTQGHANDYLSGLSEVMERFYSEIMTYGGVLETVSTQTLKVLRSGAPNAVAMAQDLLQGALNAGGTIDSSLKQLSDDVGIFNDHISADARNLRSDQTKAQQLVAGNEAMLSALKEKERAYQQELKSKRRQEIIIGIFTLGIGAAIMELTGYIKSTERDIDKAKKQATALEGDIARLGATVGALTAFVKAAAILSGLSMNLEKGWQTVSVSLQEVMDHDVPASFMEATVNSILADWDQVAAVAKNL